MPITVALFDMAATTVDDTINGRPLVLQSFEDSLNAVHVTVPWDVLNAQRGKDKMDHMGSGKKTPPPGERSKPKTDDPMRH